MNAHILVVEDDPDINNLIRRILLKNNYEVMQAFSGSEAKLLLEMKDFDIVLLDLMLPGMTGEEIIQLVRSKKDMPIIVLSAKTSLESKVNALNLGADDYITKPFEGDEILARVNSQLRRYKKFSDVHEKSKNEILTYKNLSLNESSRQAFVNEIPLQLTVHEFDILELLIKNPDKVYSRDMLYEKIWNSGYYGEDNTINVHISNLRKKIKAIDGSSQYIKTVWGIGFKLD